MSPPLTRDGPERIGGYRLAARPGTGGQGVVYEADDATGARYALWMYWPVRSGTR